MTDPLEDPDMVCEVGQELEEGKFNQGMLG